MSSPQRTITVNGYVYVLSDRQPLSDTMRKRLRTLGEKHPGFSYISAHKTPGGALDGISYNGKAMIGCRTGNDVAEMLRAMQNAELRAGAKGMR